MSDFFAAAGTHIQNAFGAAGDMFGNVMTSYGQTQIDQARGNWVFWQTLPYALPNAVQTMKDDGETGLLGGTGIGLLVGGVPGAGAGLEIGAGGGAAEGFLRGLLYAPIPHDVLQQSLDQFNSIVYPAGPSATTSPLTGLPPGLASELGLGPNGTSLYLPQGSPPANPWPATAIPGQPPAGSPNGSGTGTTVKGDLGSPPSDGAPNGTTVANTAADTATGQPDVSADQPVVSADQQVVSADAMMPVTDPTADDFG